MEITIRKWEVLRILKKIAIPVTASEHVYTILKQWILSGELTPGERIDQDAIASRLELSKMPVRSAIEKLAAQDLVVMHSHRGATVSSLTEEHLDDIYLVRCNLEGLTVKLATERMMPHDITNLTGMIREQEALALQTNSDIEPILVANREFHMYIYRLAQRPVLLTIIERLWEQSERYRRILLSEVGMVDGSINEHRRLVDLMSQKRADEASQFLIEHNRKTQQVVLSTMRTQNTKQTN
jgi:DNA-binding GntR family transcriptional regulator